MVLGPSSGNVVGHGALEAVPCADEADEGLGRGNKSPSPRTFFSNSIKESGVGDGNLSMNTHGEKNMNRFIFGCITAWIVLVENKRLWTLIMLRRVQLSVARVQVTKAFWMRVCHRFKTRKPAVATSVALILVKDQLVLIQHPLNHSLKSLAQIHAFHTVTQTIQIANDPSRRWTWGVEVAPDQRCRA